MRLAAALWFAWCILWADATLDLGKSLREDEWKEVFEALQTCMSTMNWCESRPGFLTALTRSKCEENGFIWRSRVKDYAELKELAEEKLKEVQDKPAMFLVRVSGQGGFAASCEETGVCTNENLFCSGKRFAVAFGRAKEIGELEGIDLAFALPPALKQSPVLDSYEGNRMKKGKPIERRAKIVPQRRENVVEIANKWESKHVERRSLSEGVAYTMQFRTRRELRDVAGRKVSLPSEKHSIVVLTHNRTEELNELTRDDEVLYIEPVFENRVSNLDAALLTHSGIDSLPTVSLGDFLNPLWNRGITGEGEVIGFGDSGLDLNHCYFRDSLNDDFYIKNIQPGYMVNVPAHRKVAQYSAFLEVPVFEEGHGTHVAGSLAGSPVDENEDSQPYGAPVLDRGMAYAARLAFLDMGVQSDRKLIYAPEELSVMFDLVYESPTNARIHSDSWGSDTNAYTSHSFDIDEYTYSHQDFVIVFSVGNYGFSTGGSIGAPATAKNCISVGASMNNERSWTRLGETCPISSKSACWENLPQFTSNGPTADGRMKPEVVVPGDSIISASASGDASLLTCNKVRKSGTSMSTPILAGNVALLRQALRSGFHPSGSKNASDAFEPMGALLKGMIIHSAEPLIGEYEKTTSLSGEPDFNQGYGLVRLDRVLPAHGNTASRAIFLVGDMANMTNFTQSGEFEEYRFTVSADPKVAFRATLTWYDPPASMFSLHNLVNDLDLIVISPSGEEFRQSCCNSSRDSVNTVEQVTIPLRKVESGEYVVLVNATQVVMPQPFALVVSGSFGSDETAHTHSPTSKPTNVSPSGTDNGNQGGMNGSEESQTLYIVLGSGAGFLLLALGGFVFIMRRRRLRQLENSKIVEDSLALPSL